MSKQNPLNIRSMTLGDQFNFEEMVAAAKKDGFQGIGLRAETYVDARNEGLTDVVLLEILNLYDMHVSEVE